MTLPRIAWFSVSFLSFFILPLRAFFVSNFSVSFLRFWRCRRLWLLSGASAFTLYNRDGESIHFHGSRELWNIAGDPQKLIKLYFKIIPLSPKGN